MLGYEIRIRMYLLRDIKSIDSQEAIGKFLNKMMEKTKFLKNLHSGNGLKKYSYGELEPYAKEYKEEEEYDFILRTPDIRIATEFREALLDAENNDFMVMDVDFKETKIYSKIEKLYAATPVVVRLAENEESKYWIRGMDEEILKTAIVNNLTLKYNTVNGTNVRFSSNDILEGIEVISRVPAAINYSTKKSRLLGHRMNILFKKNSFAQELAAIGYYMGVGIGNSFLGCGFVKPTFAKRGRSDV